LALPEVGLVTSYPNQNDTFSVPSNPSNTILSSAGDGKLNHVQHHQNLGDAVMALEMYSTPINHDHSGTEARPTSQLAQANTHQNADTDLAVNSLHHTIGTSSTQAAAGNHAHGDLRTQLFGSPTGTNPLLCTVVYGAQYTQPLGTDTFATAAGNWSAFYDPNNMFLNGSSGGGYVNYARILIPQTARYEIDFHALGSTGGPCLSNNYIALGTGTSAPTVTGNAVAFDAKAWNQSANMALLARFTGQITAGTYVYWATWASYSGGVANNSNPAWTLLGTAFAARTQVNLKFAGAV
jgi:hypothetical protein